MGYKIKLREIKKDIKFLDKTANASGKIRDTYIRAKDLVEQAQQQEKISPNEYATDCVSMGIENIANEAGHQIKKQVGKSFDKIRNIQKCDKVIKQSPKTTNKALKKTLKRTIKRAPKTIKNTEKTVKTAIKTSQHAAKATAKTAQATTRASKLAMQTARTAAKISATTAKVTIKTTIATVKVIIASAKGIVALIAAGGWIAVAIIILICMVGVILSYGVENI